MLRWRFEGLREDYEKTAGRLRDAETPKRKQGLGAKSEHFEHGSAGEAEMSAFASKRCTFLILASEDYGKTAGRLRELPEDYGMPKPKKARSGGRK